MREMGISLYAMTAEEVKELPKGAQIIEYNTVTGELRIRRTDVGNSFNFSLCVYLLAARPQAFRAGRAE